MVIKLHREGRRITLSILTALILLNLFVRQLDPTASMLHNIVLYVSLAAMVATAVFFRDPRRDLFLNGGLVIAPADGKIVVIEEVEESEYFRDKRLQVSIFMSFKNVHVNRHPVSGHIKYFKYHAGKYFLAWHPKSSTRNERTTIVIENEEGNFEILVRQIAGTVARRIVSYMDEGDEVEQGTELGFIKFGSRVDLFLPLDTKLNVHIGQKVKGGESIIAHLAD